MRKRRVFSVVAALLACAGMLPAGQATEKPLFSFAVIADAQYRDADPQGTRFYRNSLGKLNEAVDRINALGPQFTVQLGDLIDGRFDSYSAVLPLLGRLSMPVYHVLGNHDFAVEPDRLRLVLPTLGLDRLGEGRGFYDFGRAGWRFVVLNGDDVSVIAWPPGSPERAEAEGLLAGYKKAGAKNAEIYNGAVGAKQMAWLRSTLARAAAASERVVVFCHFPVYPPNPATLWNDTEVMAVLEAQPAVVAYFCGHKHEGDYAVHGGIHYVNLHGMVEGEQPAWALVEVFPDALRVKGVGREPSRVLSLR